MLILAPQLLHFPKFKRYPKIGISETKPRVCWQLLHFDLENSALKGFDLKEPFIYLRARV
jgi:hypothetical protein